MILNKNDQMVSDGTTIAETINKAFVNITKKNLKLKPTKTVTIELPLPEILDKTTQTLQSDLK